MKLINPDATHWYTRDGKPMHTVADRKGNDRPTTLRDARKFDLLPSVTNILGIIAKEQLVAWKIEQAVLAALTLPKQTEEGLDAFARRVVEDSQSRVSAAAAFGTEFHSGAQRVADNPLSLQETEPAYAWLVHYRDWLMQNVERVMWCERTLTNNTEGYAGTADLLVVHRTHGLCLVDLKTQGVKPGYKARPYLSWCYQLAAYRAALGSQVACINLIANSTAPEPMVEHHWTTADLEEGWDVFRSAHRIWRYEKSFDPRKTSAAPINVVAEIAAQTGFGSVLQP